MTQPIAVAHYIEPDNDNDNNSNDNNYNNSNHHGVVTDLLVPVASAHFLGSNSLRHVPDTTVPTTAVATFYNPNKPTVAMDPSTALSSTTTRNNRNRATIVVSAITSSSNNSNSNSNSNRTNENNDGNDDNEEDEKAAVVRRLIRMKRRRKKLQAAAAASGIVAGFFVFGPLGSAIGGLAAHTVVKASGRSRERRIQRQYHLTTDHNQHGTAAVAIAIPVNAAATNATRREQQRRRQRRQQSATTGR